MLFKLYQQPTTHPHQVLAAAAAAGGQDEGAPCRGTKPMRNKRQSPLCQDVRGLPLREVPIPDKPTDFLRSRSMILFLPFPPLQRNSPPRCDSRPMGPWDANSVWGERCSSAGERREGYKTLANCLWRLSKS